MNKWIFIMSIALVTSLYSCNNDTKLNGVIMVESEFQSDSDPDANGWTASFAEYRTTAVDSVLNLQAGVSRLPAPLDTTRYSLRMQSNNRSGNMFMFLKKRITGLRNNTDYQITFDVNLATQYPDAADVIGSPGSSVYLKAGASAEEPVRIAEGGIYKVNIDKGTESAGGTQMVTLGNVANGGNTFVYRLISRSSPGNSLVVRTNDKGELWLCVGTDSKYEGLVNLYYDKIKATLNLAE
jgi:hypothetical protein